MLIINHSPFIHTLCGTCTRNPEITGLMLSYIITHHSFQRGA